MTKIARAAAVAAMTVALGGVAAPAAMADVVIISESGPGDFAYSNVQNSKGVQVSQLDSVKAKVQTHVKGKLKNVPVTIEVEGAEQDQGEKA